MIMVTIEKEIKQENHIIGRFTLRQTAFIGGALILLTLFYLIGKPNSDIMFFVGLIVGAAAWYLGFHKKNGLPPEYFLWKKLKAVILMNFQRKYRTRNRYITMLNNSYRADRMADLQDKKKAKILKRRENKKTKKRSKLKAYC